MSGQPVVSVRTLSKIDVRAAVTCINAATQALVLIVDNFADHASQISEILTDLRYPDKLVVVGAERSYREDYLDLTLGKIIREKSRFPPLNQTETEQLISRYRHFGLLADSSALANPAAYARRLAGQPVAISVCQILNDFRSLDAIVESLIAESEASDLFAYLCVAIAQHCYSEGIRYSVLQAALGSSSPLTRIFGRGVPLNFSSNVNDNDFVIILQAILGERVIGSCSHSRPKDLFSAFLGLARALAPHVNRKAIQIRSPEARLAGRLFDADKIVKPLLAERAVEFYSETQSTWEWNSRYWEQRALFTSETNLTLALRYARHAVAVEKHPFSLTTLGKLLMMQVEESVEGREAAFAEAIEKLTEAIGAEENRGRISLHPTLTLLAGASRFIELGGRLSQEQYYLLRSFVIATPDRFGNDVVVENARSRLHGLL